MEPFITNILDLLYEIRDHDIPLIVGGGFGLFLKRRHLLQQGWRTLIAELPESRATNDIDLFLRAEVLADAAKTQVFADALLKLGYSAVKGAEYFQWKRELVVAGVLQEMKIDLLVGPIDQFKEKLHLKLPRVRPKGNVKLHARHTEEALAIENAPMMINVSGNLSSGERYAGTVMVPRAFPYLMMKLHAFNDRSNDEQKDLGRHHALDLYTIVGIMDEAEHKEAILSGKSYQMAPLVLKARQIVNEQFSSPTSIGMLRLREHKLFRGNFNLEIFADILKEIFDGSV